MPTFRIWQHGQSNMVLLNNSAPGAPAADIMLPIIRELVDPLGTEATIERFYDQIGTCFNGGIGMTLDNVAMTLDADGFYKSSNNNMLVRPAAPGAANFANWASWPLTARGANGITFANNVAAATKAEIACILAMHSEYETRGYVVNGWAGNDPQVVEYGWRRYFGALRAALGKTAANCPVLATVAIPYSPGSNEGFDAQAQAMRTLAADPAFNLVIVCEQTMDCTWDRDNGNGTYYWHANNDDLALLCRRIARGIARTMGPIWAPSTCRSRTDMGPRAVWAQRIDASTLDVWLKHDGGATLTLAANPTLGWQVQYNGRPIAITSITVQPDGRRLRLALAEPCPTFQLLTISYGWGNTRLLPGGAVYDDAASFDPKAVAAGVVGADRINGALRRTPVRLAVQDRAPITTP